MQKIIKNTCLSLLFMCSIFLSINSNASNVVVEKPTAMAMAGDLLLVRPVMLGVSVIGTGLYIVSLPFALMGGNAKQAGNTLVAAPLKNTFVRCLGCVKAGYKKEIQSVEAD